KLTAQLLLAEKAGQQADSRGFDSRLADPDGFDSNDFEDDEFEHLEDEAIKNVMSAESLVELEREITELRLLELLASEVRASGQDRKWVELRNILQSYEFNQPGEPRKLIVFSEHRDTLNYLEGKIRTLLGRPDA